MSLFDSYDDNRTAALNPWDVYQPVKEMPGTVLVTFRNAVLDIALEQYDPVPVAELESGGSLHIYRLGGNSDVGRLEPELAIYRTTMGAAMTVALMEEAIAMGGRNFIFFGSCGTLDASIPAGHLIVPTAAYRDEGASYHYMAAGAGDYIDIPTAEETAAVLDAMGLPYLKTRVWTTDGLYRETRRNMERRRGEGCGVVDMECAAIMAVARFRGVKAYQFLYAEDNLDDVVWDPRTMGKVPTSASELYLRAAMEIGRRVSVSGDHLNHSGSSGD